MLVKSCVGNIGIVKREDWVKTWGVKEVSYLQGRYCSDWALFLNDDFNLVLNFILKAYLISYIVEVLIFKFIRISFIWIIIKIDTD